ncbi:MAG: hypothetical protein WCH43_00060, partial [Verrucomicrobiota bacterium]
REWIKGWNSRKTVPSTRARHGLAFTKQTWLVGAEVFCLGALLFTTQMIKGRHLQSISVNAATQFIASSLPETQEITFGDQFTLLGAGFITLPDGLHMDLTWKSLKKGRLQYINAVHFVDRNGEILGGADYPQDASKSTIEADFLWHDTIVIPLEKLQKATAIGLAIYSGQNTGVTLLPINRGFRDWNGRRLIVPLENH